MANKKNTKTNSTDKKGLKPKRTTESKKNNGSKADKGDTNTSTKGESKGESKMTLCTLPTMGCRPQTRERRPGRPSVGKRIAITRDMPAKVRSAFRRSLDPCDNSNDSGLGFDHHGEPHHHHTRLASERVAWNEERTDMKRPRIDIKLEHDDINDGYCFPETIKNCKENTNLIRTAPAGSIPSLSMNNNQSSSSGRVVPRCVPLSTRQSASQPVSLTAQLGTSSRYSDISLTIVKQPEQQHRARYQTEGSRGAVKDREGSGFPVVQLTGYYQPTTLQVFIGTDVGKVAPHMFYQACKVSGKNSTPCVEKKIDGTCVIELQLDPSREMSATCDCVGILKERNVDVEHRFPDQLGNRSKKKSTKCRMIFRTNITHEDGSIETLQVCSQPIVCTQPPGIPEISKKSLTSCPASGGLELFVLGKNFLKDTKVLFQLYDDDRQIRWEQVVVPDKEYLQQTHFVCVVPPYRRPDITEPVTVRLSVASSGKTSESHQFVYTPVNGAIPSGVVDGQQQQQHVTAAGVAVSIAQTPPPPPPPPPQLAKPQSQFFKLWPPSMNKREDDLGMMPPPESNLVPISTRRGSISLSSPNGQHSPPLGSLKQEYIDENSQNSMVDSMDMNERFRHISESSLDVQHGDSNMSMINENSIDMINHSTIDSSNASVEEVLARHNRMRNLCENSMDINCNSSQLSPITDDSSCCHSLLPPHLLPPRSDDLKVMDLRMKMPMATVADLASSSAPSMATLQSFGVTELSTKPLIAQSAQSVESYLTDIEAKINTLSNEQNAFQQKLLSPPVLHKTVPTSPSPSTTTAAATTTATAVGMAEHPPVYLSSRDLLAKNDAIMHLVAKSEAAAIAENITETTTTTTTISTMPLGTEKLDALVNSTVESHIGSPTKPDADSLITSRDVMLNSRGANLMVPTIINTSSISSPILAPDLSQPTTDVILNSQISPSLMCRNTQDIIPPPIVTTVDSTILSVVPPSVVATTLLTTEPEKAVLLKAAVDFLETQKKLNELEHVANKNNNGANVIVDELVINENQTTSQLQQQQQQTVAATAVTSACDVTVVTGNNFIHHPHQMLTQDNKADFVIPVPVKEMTQQHPHQQHEQQQQQQQQQQTQQQQEKKNDDRMIPQFTSFTENELINFINPSCFDQV